MIYFKVFLKFIFNFPGTLSHEIAHWIGAKLTFSKTPLFATIEETDSDGKEYNKRVLGFKIIPSIKEDRIVYGHVIAYPIYKMAYIIIAAAPLVWFYVLYLMLNYYGLLNLNIENGSVYMEFDFYSFFSFSNLLIIYLSLQLVWAGTLSSQDIKMFFVGVFSLSSLIVISSLIIIYSIFVDNHLITDLFTRINS